MQELIDQFNLPKYTKGKSFADASSMIMDKFRERKDPESKRTMTELLDRLRQAQEFVKEQNKTPEEREQEQMQMQEQQMQQEQPQDVNPQMEEQMVQEQPQQQMQQTQFANGGLMNYISKNNSSNDFANGGFIDDKTQSDAQMNQAIGGAQDAVASAFGPIGGLVRGVQKAGGAIGDVIGGDVGATVGGMFNPIEGTMSVLTDKDASTGQKILGAVPGLGGLVSKKLADKRELEQNKNKVQLGRNQALNTFALGGSINPDPKYPQNPNDLIKSFKTNKEGLNYQNPYPNRSDRWNAFDAYQSNLKRRASGINGGGALSNNKTITNVDDNNSFTFNNESITSKDLNSILNKRSPVDYNSANNAVIQKAVDNQFANGGKMNTNQYALGDWLKTAGKNIGTAASKTGEFLNENKGDILRYTPTAINAAQLATLPKAEVESLNRLDNRYKPGYVDEAALQNTARENYNMTSQALSGASGGSTSALRSNILGAGLNRNKALSNAYLKASDINRGEDAKAQQFNLGVDRVNLQQSNSEKDINARNRAARDNAKSKLLSGIGTDIGNIGKEEKYKDIIEKVSGYNQKGELENKKKPKVKSITLAQKDISKPTVPKIKHSDALDLKPITFNKSDSPKKKSTIKKKTNKPTKVNKTVKAIKGNRSNTIGVMRPLPQKTNNPFLNKKYF